MKQIIKNLFTLTLVVGMVLVGYSAMEPAVLLAQSATDEVQVSLTVDSGITISSPSDVTMSPNLSVTQNTSTGDVAWTVTTNDTDGYTLTVQASTSPALQSAGDDFPDYTETVENTPEAWSVTSAYEFGFGAHGTDVTDGTWGAGTACNDGGAGNIPADINYQGFNGTTSVQVASSNTVTSTTGTASTVCFAAEQDGVFAPSGAYSGIIVATATVQ